MSFHTLQAVRLENPHEKAPSMELLPVVTIKPPYFAVFSAGFLVVQPVRISKLDMYFISPCDASKK